MYDKPRLDAFRNICIQFDNNAEGERIQKAAHTLGFRWGYQRGYENRGVVIFPAHFSGYIHIDGDYRMSWSCTSNSRNTRSIANIEHTAAEFKLWKKGMHKTTKRRSALRKWERTARPHTGDTSPVHPNTLVSVRLRDGLTLSGRAHTFRWRKTDSQSDIVSYKILRANKHSEKPAEPKIITLEAMVEGVAWDLGKGVAIPVHDFGSEEYVPQKAGNAAADTNPKRQYGVASVPLNMWSPLASAYGALGLYNGSLKYGTANFANTPVEASIYIAAAFRHLSAWAAGEEFDPADGVPNLGGLLANVAILLEARAAGTLIDDRPKMSGYLKERDALKDIVKKLNDLHADKNPKHYTLGG